jgi:hypothetical protein
VDTAILRHSAVLSQFVRQFEIAIQKHSPRRSGIVKNGDSRRLEMAMPGNLHVPDLVVPQQWQDMSLYILARIFVFVAHLGSDHDQLVQRSGARGGPGDPSNENACPLHSHSVREQCGGGHESSSPAVANVVPRTPMRYVPFSAANLEPVPPVHPPQKEERR